jgi:oligopeptide transport system substrate-binding protein
MGLYSMIRLSKKIRWQLPLAIVAMLLQVACNKQQPKVADNQAPQAQQQIAKANKLRINIGDEPCSLDPAKARDLRSITLVRMLFDGLTRVGKDDKVEMAIAEKVQISEDKLTYTFTLREANWSNGEPVTADDFLYAWKRALDPNTPADNAFQLYAIKNASAIKSGNLELDELGVRVINSKTLEVELEQPTPYFLELTSYPVYYPINGNVDQENSNWSSDPATYVGNGPFSLADWKHEDCITMKKNPTYWDQETVHLEEISMYMLQSETELSMFENHEIDWAGSPLSVLPIDALGKLKAENLLHKKPILGTYFLRLNTDNQFLGSSNIRKALSLSINREELVEHALAGSQVAASGYVPEIFGLRQSSYFKGDNRHEAIKYFEEGLDELTLTRSEVPQLEIIYPNSERNQRIAQLLQERWQKVLGIKLALFAMEPKVYFEKVAQGDYEIAAGSWMADFNDPISFLEIFKSKKAGANHTRWENKEYASLIDSCATVLDASERTQMLARCEKILIDSMPVIPLFHYNLLYIKDSKLQDVFISNMGVMDFRWAKFQ